MDSRVGPGPPQDPVRRAHPRETSSAAISAGAAVELRPVGGPGRPQPSTRKGAWGRSAHRPDHLGERLPRRRGLRGGQCPGGTSALTGAATGRHSLTVMTARRIVIVPHTHWDREWYKPFQDFRLALVELIDNLLPLLEQDASYPDFMLDGQMAVVDDYLEVRPEAEERLRALAAAGRLRWARGTSSWTSSSPRARPSCAICRWA